MNPMQVAQNRTARLVQEHTTPVYTSTRATQQARILAEAERRGCTKEYCFICSRATDHFAEHSDEQILRYARKVGIR